MFAYNEKKTKKQKRATRVERELSWKETRVSQQNNPLLLKLFDSVECRVPCVSVDPYADRISDLRGWVHCGLHIYFAVDCGQDHKWNKHEGELHRVQWCGKDESHCAVVPPNSNNDARLCTFLTLANPLKALPVQIPASLIFFLAGEEEAQVKTASMAH